jgi:endonuclease YncB( thermonuclease family)
MKPRAFLVATLLLTLLSTGESFAANATIKDGSTLQLGGVTYRLDGIDAPAVDQLCIDEHADPWTCGIEARDQLTKLIGGREVRCDDLGVDPTYKRRHLGVCKIEGETTSLSQSLVGLGFALNVEASATGRFETDQARAKEDRQGLWKGCFVAPQEFRLGKKDGALLGGSCPADRDPQIRAALFPRRSRDALDLQHQGQVRHPCARHRQCRNLPSAGLPQLPCAHQAGSLVLFRGRRAGRRVPQGL